MTARGGGMDWPGLVRAGLCGLRLAPAEFWRLTPAELALMLGAPLAGGGLDRARLEELARAFPDRGRCSSTSEAPETRTDR
jgi:uncharacterized phage protein (TIGR02216 family)